MLFNSYAFLLFLPLALLLYWSTQRWLRLQTAVLVATGYLFYGWWDMRFLWLIIGMTLIGYGCGRGIAHWGRTSQKAQFLCTLCVVSCLVLLGIFKYYDFFAQSLSEALGQMGLSLHLPFYHLILPVGISFYTFQILSYALDVKRGTLPACKDLTSFAAFVCFFPQLVAGPIERANHLLPQMQHRRALRYADAVDGMHLILWGFFKKMLIADRCAPIVQAIYANPQADGTDLWMAAVLFAFQIYGDFSGYSDIAIGTARLFGIRLTTNFSLPYFSADIATFWRRWHITLMTWFKDYLYIPLGGSRRGKIRQALNISLVFLVSGLWHGANWTFVAWGAYQALWFLPLLFLRKSSSSPSPTAPRPASMLPTLRASLQMGLTFLIVCIGWVFFRSETVGSAFTRIVRMLTDLSFHTPYGGLSSLLPIVCLVLIEWTTRHRKHPLDFPATGLFRYRAVRWSLYYLLLFLILYAGGQQSAFIYFQF